jgi:hypothetical protein
MAARVVSPLDTGRIIARALFLYRLASPVQGESARRLDYGLGHLYPSRLLVLVIDEFTGVFGADHVLDRHLAELHP